MTNFTGLCIKDACYLGDVVLTMSNRSGQLLARSVKLLHPPAIQWSRFFGEKFGDWSEDDKGWKEPKRGPNLG